MKTITFFDEQDKIMIDGKVYVCLDETKPEPEFKVPGWYVFTGNSCKLEIFRTIKLDAMGYLHNEADTQYLSEKCRPATPAEIETYLRKICDEKGFKPGVRYKNAYLFGEYHTYPDNPIFRYGKTGDSFDCGDGYGFLYYNGKFAEIIPDKKKLPKTKEEFIIMIDQAWQCKKGTTIDEFLNQYNF
jgi:hypothetical protein